LGARRFQFFKGLMRGWSGLLFTLLLYTVCSFITKRDSASVIICKAYNSIGESGLDGTLLLPAPSLPAITSTAAIDAIAAALLATPLHTSWLVATGTLTNIAQLFDKYPILVYHIKGLSIMGGAIGNSFTSAPLGRVGTVERFGNWTPFAGKFEPKSCVKYSYSIPAKRCRI
jgi:hypothetical protein